ncbi:hypothetical protein COV06_00715 [Candidatus Uhrbacteria bacterium CG10_big_fil_rev_8_21_14_0_10_50_16]|uniref:Hydrolase TatD n=1 Tax=Candidatus Uhrbacteria bacterium CG10_big_fil_rev_8_21_14_0_10_50_16 TaxID=1975039 RepID=A0A2H0RMX7_9BACT|nr:MAG: hypothetical protein COV06_00715 [Candidatus Uhrbacteria bacterium CG10_big_fil_rev_8_21_14_0_10_50_16]
MIDTHCHVHFQAYETNGAEVIKRSQAQGVEMITIGTQSTTSKEAIVTAESHEGIWCTVGLHPSHTHQHTLHTDQNEATEGQVENFNKEYYRDLIQRSNKVVAIGEVGLDYFRVSDEVAADVKLTQKIELWKAMELATETDLPLVLHIRDAHADMQALIRAAQEKRMISRGAVIHCFTGTTEEARAYHDLGIYTSFTGIITFRDKKHPDQLTPLMKTVQELPLEMMMIETDSPYLAPEPHRGEQNEPWMVRFVAEKIAELKGISVEEVDRITTNTAKTFFQLAERS